MAYISEFPPKTIPGNPPPKVPKLPPGYKSWKDYWKFRKQLRDQNPTLVFMPPEVKPPPGPDEEEDEIKKKKRIAEIKAAKKFKSKGTKTSISSGLGTVSPILYSYPGSYTDEGTGGGFSFSQIPSIVWIILAVAGGIFMIKSARKR